MMSPRRALIAALAATAALAVGAPAASASPVPTAFGRFAGMPMGVPSVPGDILAAGGCVTATSDVLGRTGGINIQSCGLSFIGPATQISTVIGPTIITPAFVGSSIVAGGNVAVGP
jgi:hypothetical protein